MKNRWSPREAAQFVRRYAKFGEDVALRTYTARLIGRETNLVLHGGGNTSVKTTLKALTGEDVSVLCVKGSGWDLDTIEPAGHPAVKLDALLDLRKLDQVSDEDMVNALRSNMLDSSGPNPSVETLLHAFLPHKFIDHTHADAVLSLADQPAKQPAGKPVVVGIEEWSKGKLAVVPYIMPGFRLARLAAEVYERNPHVEGLVLYKHGIFTFGETARESYERMIKWVSAAENYLNKAKPFRFSQIPSPKSQLSVAAIAQILRGTCVLPGGRSMIVRRRATPKIMEFVNSRDAKTLSQIGPATPDHVIRTKPRPLYIDPASLKDEATFKRACVSALDKFKRAYAKYVATQMKSKKVRRMPLDPCPRMAIVPGAGIFALAETAKAADIALDIYEHTIGIIENAMRVGRYEALDDSNLFDMEYWSLEQAKLGKSTAKPLSGKVVWISGAASGIGLSTAKAFAKEGAHVFSTDMHDCDVTKVAQVEKSFERCAETFGGVDIVVSNAGYAPTGFMKDLDDDVLRRSFEVNFFAHQNVARAAAKIFERQKLGGCMLFNASKSTFNPGAEFGPYTLPKTSVIGLMKQYAVELGGIGVRSNAVNADRVRTGLYADGLLNKRAKSRGVSVDKYLAGNLLGKEVLAEDVAQAFVYLAHAKKTTGATLPVDGGNAAAFPR